MKNIQWLFFDIGSTLVDESECYRQRVLAMIQGTDITYDDFFSDMLSFYQKGEKGDKMAAAKYGLTVPSWKSEDEFLFPNAKRALEKLRQRYRLGIIANQEPGTAQRLRSFGIDGYFDVIATSAEAGVAKPDPRIFLLALERAGCAPEEAVMIGDRLDNDIAPANRLGMKTVRILQGFGQFAPIRNADENADYTVSDLDELYEILS